MGGQSTGRRERTSGRRWTRATGATAAAAMVLTLVGLPADAATTISEYGTPTSNSVPAGITLGPGGNMWYTECANQAVGYITPGSPPTFSNEFQVGGCPVSITSGPDGNLWFTDSGFDDVAYVGRITTAGVVTRFPLPSGVVFPTEDGNGVDEITAGSDGNIWFAAYGNGAVGTATAYAGQITPSGTMHLFTIEENADAFAIAAGPDGNLWVTTSDGLAQVTTSGSATLFPGDEGVGRGITAWDGELWLANGSSVKRIATNGTGGDVSLPSGTAAYGGVAPGSCTNTLWYAGGDAAGGFTSVNNYIGTISNLFVVTPLNTPTANSDPLSVATGTGGSVWYTESSQSVSQLAQVVDKQGLIACVPLLPGGILVHPTVNGRLGGSVGWQMLAPGTHGIADASGMNLYGYTDAGGPTPLPIGSSMTFAFDWSGVYPYDDPFKPATKGKVNVPVLVTKVSRTTNQAKVTWASQAPPSGFGVDVEIQSPGSTDWGTWQSGVSSQDAVFGPSDPLWAGTGTYKFRARLRQLTTNDAAGFSAAKSIALH